MRCSSATRVELSIAFARIEELEAVIADPSLNVEPIPRAALLLAGKVFPKYRRARDIERSVVPDFHVGAHAAIAHCPNARPSLGYAPRGGAVGHGVNSYGSCDDHVDSDCCEQRNSAVKQDDAYGDAAYGLTPNCFGE
jgi:hypothetical protein